jgi:branched-chain amino acid transport system substrate-binding protein
MPRWRALLASATVLVAVASGGAATHAAAPPEPRSVQTLILGTALPDTGSLKAYGPATQAAVRLAVDDANAAGGVLGSPVELVPGDSGGVGSTTFARTLTRLGAVDAIIGPLSSQLVLDNIGAVTGHTLVSPAATSPQLSGVLARTVQAEPLAGAMLATLAKQRGAVRLVVVGPRDQRPLMDAALDRGRDIGLQVSSVLHTPTQSAATIASKVVRSSADAILLASREQATSILRELLVRGLPATVLLSPGAAT